MAAGPQQYISGAPDNLRGILWMLTSVAAFTVMGMVIKEIASEVSLAMIVLFRQWVVLLILVPWLLRAEAREIRTERQHGARGQTIRQPHRHRCKQQ